MNNENLKKFVDTYSKYYFTVSTKEKEEAKKIGVTINHSTTEEKENRIMAFLKNKEQNIETIAWKMGVDVTEDGLKTRYHKYERRTLSDFCDKAKELELQFDTEEKIRKSYDDLLSLITKIGLDGYGSVYIISSLFFLSGGKVPIYDYYANVAVKALLFDVCPQRIFVAQAPAKDKHSRGDKRMKSAVNMLMEYRKELEILSEGTEYFNSDGMYISRDLDRALWVYGHATRKWPFEESK